MPENPIERASLIDPAAISKVREDRQRRYLHTTRFLALLANGRSTAPTEGWASSVVAELIALLQLPPEEDKKVEAFDEEFEQFLDCMDAAATYIEFCWSLNASTDGETSTLHLLSDQLGLAYDASDAGARNVLETFLLEHLLENPAIHQYFETWRTIDTRAAGIRFAFQASEYFAKRHGGPAYLLPLGTAFFSGKTNRLESTPGPSRGHSHKVGSAEEFEEVVLLALVEDDPEALELYRRWASSRAPSDLIPILRRLSARRSELGEH